MKSRRVKSPLMKEMASLGRPSGTLDENALYCKVSGGIFGGQLMASLYKTHGRHGGKPKKPRAGRIWIGPLQTGGEETQEITTARHGLCESIRSGSRAKITAILIEKLSH